MYRSLNISNFRGITNLEANSLSQINLLVGPNNAGKTTILEALFLLTGSNPDIPISVNVHRGISAMRVELSPWGEMPWNSLFGNFDTTKKIEIFAVDREDQRVGFTAEEKPFSEYQLDLFSSTSTSSDIASRSGLKKLRITFSRNSQSFESDISFDQSKFKFDSKEVIPSVCPLFFLPAGGVNSKDLNERYGLLVEKGLEIDLLKTLQMIEPKIKGIYSVTIAGVPQLLIGVEGVVRKIPIQYLGSGTNRLAMFAIHLLSLESGILLIDEIENGLYYKSLPHVWKILGELSRSRNIQIFATTHSDECVAAAHEVLSEIGSDFSVWRVDAKPSATKMFKFDRELLDTALEQQIEVR